MKEYLYLFRGGDARELQQSPEDMQAHMEKWKQWMGKLSQSGSLVGGLPLENEGKVVAGSAKLVTDGPYTEGKEIVGGYLIVKADSLDNAVELSRECPIFEGDGTVEVRAITSMDM